MANVLKQINSPALVGLCTRL